MVKNISLPVLIFKEGDMFVVHTPALDISSCAKTVPAAKKNFQELVDIFFEELEEKGTTDEVLESLGWEKRDSSWQAPSIIESSVEQFRIPTGA